MKTILNKTPKPIKIRLPGGKTLHLAPLKTGRVSDRATTTPSFEKLLKAGEIEIMDGEASKAATESGIQQAQESKRGHRQSTSVMPKGDR